MKGIFLLVLFFKAASAYQLLSITIRHTLTRGEHIKLQALLSSRNPSELLPDRGFSKQVVGKKGSAHWDLSSAFLEKPRCGDRGQ